MIGEGGGEEEIKIIDLLVLPQVQSKPDVEPMHASK